MSDTSLFFAPAESLDTTGRTHRFRGTPVEKHWCRGLKVSVVFLRGHFLFTSMYCLDTLHSVTDRRTTLSCQQRAVWLAKSKFLHLHNVLPSIINNILHYVLHWPIYKHKKYTSKVWQPNNHWSKLYSGSK